MRFTGFWGFGGLREIALALFGAKNGPKTPKSGFSRSWGLFWAKCPSTKFDGMINADSLNSVWGPMCPWGPRHRHSRGGLGPFCRLGTQPPKQFRAVSKNVFSSKTERCCFFSGPWCTLWGPCALQRLSRFKAETNSDLKNVEKKVEIFIFCWGCKKCVFVENRAIFFPFLALGAPYRGRAH